LIRSKKTDHASDRGWFVFDSVEAGPDLLLIRAIGFRPKRIPLGLGEHDTLDIAVTLEARVQLLPEVSVTGKGPAEELSPLAVEAAHRIHWNGAPGSALITRKELARWAKHDFRDAFRRAGLNVMGDFAVCPWRASRGKAPRSMTVYLDGMRFSEENRFDVRAIPPEWVDAIEVYQSVATRPPEYNMTSSTGCLVLIWTRR
jgi:hypothetical protein